MNTNILELTPQQAEFKSYETLHPFLWAGNATFTLISRQSRTRFTYKITKPEWELKKPKEEQVLFYAAVLNGPDNIYNYLYLGQVNIVDQSFRTTSGSKVSKSAPSMIAFEWFIRNLFRNPIVLFSKAEIYHEGRCGRCGRKLTVPESIASGFGPECISKL